MRLFKVKLLGKFYLKDTVSNFPSLFWVGALLLFLSRLKSDILGTQSPKCLRQKGFQSSFHLCTWLPNPYKYLVNSNQVVLHVKDWLLDFRLYIWDVIWYWISQILKTWYILNTFTFWIPPQSEYLIHFCSSKDVALLKGVKWYFGMPSTF